MFIPFIIFWVTNNILVLDVGIIIEEQRLYKSACVWNETVFVAVKFSNSQVMLRGCETAGYVIVSAAAASILSSIHNHMWQQQQLKSKTSWVGSVECMQVGGW